MALDWNKEISFSGLKKRAPKPKDEFPSKTYMNLMVSEKKSFDLRSNIPLIVVLLIIVVLVMKFGVFDFYARVDAKQAELNAHQQTLNSLNAELTNYNTVLEEYEGYESMIITSSGLRVDALEALNLVDRFVAPSARVVSISLVGNTLTLNLTDISLDGVGKLASTLYEQDMVANVSVSTAATQETASKDVTAAITITLATVEE